MPVRFVDWFLIGLALIAVVLGYLFNGPFCYPSLGLDSSSANVCQLRFPAELAMGVALALLLLGAVFVRRRRRAN